MANEYLKRTPTSTGNRKVFTISFWKKHAGPGGLSTLDFSAVGNAVNDNNNRSILYWSDSNSFDYYHNLAGVEKLRRGENQGAHRDPSSWCHTLVSTDTTKNETKIYINGTEIQYSLITNTQNFETWINSTYKHSIGSQFGGSFFNKTNYFDFFLVDGQALTPEVFGFYKDGNGYISAGSTQATDFRNGQWVPRTPREIKNLINENGGFGVNGFYLPMNDSSNFGADFHCEPNSIITLKGENLPQPRNGAPETTDAYVSQLREDPYAANLVLAVPGISTSTSANLVSNGTFENGTSGWTADTGATLSILEGALRITVSQTAGARQSFPVTSGQRYTLSFRVRTDGTNFSNFAVDAGGTTQYIGNYSGTGWTYFTKSFTPTSSTVELRPYKATGGWAEFDDIVFKQEDVPRDYSADIKGSGTNKTLTVNGNAGVGYEVPGYYGSALSFDGGGDYFTVSASSDLKLNTTVENFTIECWVNLTDTSTTRYICGLWDFSASQRSWLLWANSNVLTFGYSLNGTTSNFISGGSIISNQWNHVAVVKNETTIILYLNGVATATSTNIISTFHNPTTTNFQIGADWESTQGRYFVGNIQDLRVYKGVAKYTGGFDVPKPYTPVGIATWRAVSDTVQNNFAILNPVDSLSATTSNGNLTTNLSAITGGYQQIKTNFAVTSGKWYWEIRAISAAASNAYMLGVSRTGFIGQYGFWGSTNGWYYYGFNGTKYNGSGAIPYGSSYTAGDIIGIALDMDNSQLTFYKNGISQGLAFKNVTGTISPTIGSNTTIQATINFGQNSTFSGIISAGTFTDASGKGLFQYQPPAGFLALCEDNLPTPTIKNPGEYFKTVIWTGDGTIGRSITGVGFKPDLVWIKGRNTVSAHFAYNSISGPRLGLNPNLPDAETNYSDGLLSFDNDGFSLGNRSNNNGNTNTFTAWCWKAGNETITNTDGSIISKVNVNQPAGFSIVSYVGTGSLATVGHGLGKEPTFIIIKSRSSSRDWIVYHKSAGNTGYILLNATSAFASASTFWNNTTPSSSTFTIESALAVNASAENFIAYCWTEIEGFSKFGSYIGNGSADGPFVDCGFKPAVVIVKSTAVSTNWLVWDNTRTSNNPSSIYQILNNNLIDQTNGADIDFVSNGFKVRNTSGSGNGSGGTLIFAAFAESPFKYANSK
jgi:hypothetical protein